MNILTLPDATSSQEPFNAAQAVLEEISADGGPLTEGDFSALAMLLIDATLRGDELSLKTVQEWLRWEYGDGVLGGDEAGEHASRNGRLLGLIDASHWAIERVLPVASLSRLERGGYTARFLRELQTSPGLSNTELANMLAVDETEVSRVGRRLLDDGMAIKRRVGRRNFWEISPKGRRSLQLLDGARTDQTAGENDTSARDAVNEPAETAAQTAGESVLGRGPSTLLRAVGGALLELLDHDGELQEDALYTQVAAVADVDAETAQGAVERVVSNHFATRTADTGTIVLNEQRASAIGVNITAQNVVGVLVGPRGTVLGEPHQYPLAVTDVQSVVETVTRVTRKALAAQKDPGDGVLGLGVALAGHVDGAKGRVMFSTELRENDQFWQDVPLARMLSEACGLPVVIENDANALTVHEQLYGSGTDLADFVAVLLSDGGLGCGVVSEGIPVHGHQGLAGELGHLLIDANGDQCRCGNRGCLETIVSLQGIRRAYAKHAGSAPVEVTDVFGAAAEDELSADVLAAAGATLGQGLSTLLNLVNPARVVVFAPPVLWENEEAAEIFKRAVLSTATQYSFSVAAQGFDLIFRRADDTLGAVGAASLVLNKVVGRHNVVKGTSRPLTQRAAALDSDRAEMVERAFIDA